MNKLLMARLGVLVDLGTSLSGLKSTFQSEFEGVGWRVVGESDTDANRYFDVIPPANQAIGNANGREVLRVIITSTQIIFNPYVTSVQDKPKVYRISIDGQGLGNQGYRVSARVGSAVVSAPASNAGGGYDANTGLLYSLLTGSTDPEISSYDYVLNTPGGAYDDFIVATAKTLSAPPIYSSAGQGSYDPTVTLLSSGYAAGTPVISPQQRVAVGTDLAAGFVYYLSITERTVSLATKTTSAFAGPIVASYVDHDSAAGQTPRGCVPIELLALDLSNYNTDNGSNAGVKYTHFWGATRNTSDYGFVPAFDRGARAYSLEVAVEDLIAVGGVNVPDFYSRVLDSQGMSVARWQKIFGLSTGIVGLAVWAQPYNYADEAFGILPTLSLPDVFAFIGPASDESLQFTQDVNSPVALTAPLAAEDTTVALESTAAFAAAGFAIIGKEAVQYTGKTATTLTGLTRARYGTAAQASASGRLAYPGLWFMKARGGAMLAGYTRPA